MALAALSSALRRESVASVSARVRGCGEQFRGVDHPIVVGIELFDQVPDRFLGADPRGGLDFGGIEILVTVRIEIREDFIDALLEDTFEL